MVCLPTFTINFSLNVGKYIMHGSYGIWSMYGINGGKHTNPLDPGLGKSQSFSGFDEVTRGVLQPKAKESWYCWWFRNPANQLRLAVFPMIYRVVMHPRWVVIAGFLKHQLRMVFKLLRGHGPGLKEKKSSLTPPKINGWNLKMMVWFRWFSFSRGPVFSGSCHSSSRVYTYKILHQVLS